MLRMRSVCLAVAMLLVLSLTDPAAGEPKQENKLLGTWKLISGKYGEEQVEIPEGITQLKHVTPVQFMWGRYGKDGKGMMALGGSYTLKGQTYEEVPEYGVGEELVNALKGKRQSFQWKIEGNKWHHTGKLSSGQSIDEVWERVEKK